MRSDPFHISRNAKSAIAFARVFSILVAISVLPVAQDLLAQETEHIVASRVHQRDFPSIFQAWNGAENLGGNAMAAAARHDLLFNMPSYFGLKWNQRYRGLGTSFLRTSVQEARVRRRKFHRLNPQIIMLAELRYWEAPANYLPRNHRWWKASNTGGPEFGWAEGGSLKLDLRNEEFRQHVSQQARAIMQSQAVDGILLDSWHDSDPLRIDLLRRIRTAVGDEALILVNANDRKCPLSAKLINGHYMECARADSVDDWNRIAETLSWAEKHVRPPAINCLETGFRGSRKDLNRMRATTTLSLALSNGYSLFADPNTLPTPDHLHDWYTFWDASLGKPMPHGKENRDGAFVREFENGFAVYNPPGNGSVRLIFSEQLMSVAHRKKSTHHVISSFDGDILLKVSNDD